MVLAMNPGQVEPSGHPQPSGSEDAAARHARQVATTLQLRAKPADNWVPPRPGTDFDVVVVGGGQSGVAIAWALGRAGIGRILVIDAAQEGAEGVWLTSARMNRLRSPKTLPGPELDIPELGFQAWFEARQGEAAYAALGFVSRLDWAAYLAWFRQAVGVSPRFGTRLDAIEPVAEGIRLSCTTPDGPQNIVCRKLVFATGFAGSGGANVPAYITAAVPPIRYAHVESAIDFDALRNRRVAIFGSGSSAFDAAAVALEAGAQAAHVFCRHDDLERTSPMRMLYYPGSVEHFRDLSDADRWQIMSTLCSRAQGPVPETVLRATAHHGFHLHLGARDPQLQMEGNAIVLTTGGERLPLAFDFVIAGTGYTVDLSARLELARISDEIALWRDRYIPPADRRNAELERYPYLTPGFALTEKVEGRAGYLRNIHLFGAGALLSNGRNPGEVSGFRYGVPQLVSAIGSDLFRADGQQHVARILGPCQPLLSGDEYRHCVWSDARSNAPCSDTDAG